MAAPLIVIGASAGGVEALRALVSGLAVDHRSAVAVVLHIPRASPSALPAILDRSGPLPVYTAEHGMELRPGAIYVAPADHHLLISDQHLELSPGPSENGHRPAIDPLFRSAAVAYGPGAIGVVLSGARDDGTAGLVSIVSRGGQAVVQDPADALHPSMPRSALEHVPDALVHPASAMGAALSELVGCGDLGADPPDHGATSESDFLLRAEAEVAALAPITTNTMPAARPSGLTCPSCQGVLFELPGEPAPRFRCRVGHAWSPEALDGEQDHAIDSALWAALRALEEKAELLRRLAEVSHRRGRHRHGAVQRLRAERTEAEAGLVRKLVRRVPSAAPVEVDATTD